MPGNGGVGPAIDAIVSGGMRFSNFYADRRSTRPASQVCKNSKSNLPFAG